MERLDALNLFFNDTANEVRGKWSTRAVKITFSTPTHFQLNRLNGKCVSTRSAKFSILNAMAILTNQDGKTRIKKNY